MPHFLLNKKIKTNHQTLIDRILGKWIVQSTIYSFINNQVKNSMAEIQWLLVQNKCRNLEVIMKNIDYKWKDIYSELYVIESNDTVKSTYHIFLFNDKLKKGYIIRTNTDFKILQKSVIQYYSNNCLYVCFKDIKNKEIIEKMYFLNDNLKVIQSIMQKNKKCTGICFSSEIKIS